MFLLPIVVVLALVAALVLTLRSCVFTDKAKTDYTLEFSAQTIVVGSTATVKMIGLPENSDEKITWSSSDISIVTVNDGTLTAKKIGTATISAGVNKKNITGTVKVVETAEGVKSLTLTPGSVKIISGKTAQLKHELLFDNDTPPAVSPSWSTTNPAVASVTDGLVTARDVGTATITATVGDKSGTCTVTVEKDANGQPAGSDEGIEAPPEEPVTEPVKEPTVPPAGDNTTATPPATDHTGTANNSSNTPNNDNTSAANNSNVGTSDNTGNTDTAGNTGATNNNDTGGGDNTGASKPTTPAPVDSLGLSQDTAYLDLGDTLSLEAYVSPSGASVAWTSSDPAIATVSTGGVVSAKGAGSVIITATAGGVFTFCTIDIATPAPEPEAPVPEDTATP